MLPTVTGSGAAAFVIERSEIPGALTVLLTRAVLFAVFPSGSLAVTVAVLVTVPVGPVMATIVTVASVPTVKMPMLQFTVPAVAEQLPRVEVAETNEMLEGNVSVIVTPVADAGPLLVTFIV